MFTSLLIGVFQTIILFFVVAIGFALMVSRSYAKRLAVKGAWVLVIYIVALSLVNPVTAGLEILLTAVTKALPVIVDCAVITFLVAVVVTAVMHRQRYPKKPLLPANAPSLGEHRQRRARSTGGRQL